jgi:hypothetical protein
MRSVVFFVGMGLLFGALSLLTVAGPPYLESWLHGTVHVEGKDVLDAVSRNYIRYCDEKYGNLPDDQWPETTLKAYKEARNNLEGK